MASFWTRFNSLMLVLVFLALVGVLAMLARDAYGGPLDPAGTPGPTMKTLQEVEPRTPISSLPFTISQPGSYYLTGNLTIASAQNGITIAASEVTLDLRGFALDGANVGTNAVATDGSARQAITVVNGAATRWTAIAFDLGGIGVTNIRLKDLHVRGGTTGFRIADGVLANCTARDSTSIGVSALVATVTNCTADTNNATGFSLDRSNLRDCNANFNLTGVIAERSIVEGCQLHQNNVGIQARESTIRGNNLSQSIFDGISLTTGTGHSNVTDNLVKSSGTGGVSQGIFVTTNYNRVSRNTVVLTNGRGIRVEGSYNTIDGNSAFNNNVAGVVAGGMGFYVLGVENTVILNSASDNKTNGAPVNYSFGPGNNDAPVQAAAVATNPLANTE